ARAMQPEGHSARHPAAARDATATRAASVRFALLFVLLAGALTAIASTDAARVALHEPASRAVAVLTSWPLRLLGDVAAQGDELSFDGFRAVVVEACNGVLPTLIYCAAVLAFPSRWRDKAIGVAIGVPAILLVNVVRVASLMVLGAHWPSLFERMHIFVWQTLVIALAMAVWIYWVEAWVQPDEAAPAKR
ncbi:MAG: exosortase H, partial [Thermodesulfobacteriota bacterium]